MAGRKKVKKSSKPKNRPKSRPRASTSKKKVINGRVDTNERLRLALTSARMGIWEWDLKTNAVIWSEEVERMFGLEPGEFGNSFEAYLTTVHPDDREHCQRTIQEYIEGKTKTFILQNRVIFKDGEIHWVEGRGEVYRDRKGNPARMIGTVIDITETKRVEEELRRSEHRLRQAQHLVRLGIWEWEIATDQANWAGAMFDIYGVKQEEFTGKGADYLKFTHPEDREKQRQNIKNAFEAAAKAELNKDRTRHARIVPREFRIIRPSGEIRFVMSDSWAVADEKGRPLRMLGTLMDMTEVRRTTEKLQESQRFVERIAVTSPHIMYVFDILERRTIWVNRPVPSDLGFSPAECEAMGDGFIVRLLHPDDLARMSNLIARWDTARDGEILEVEYRLKNARGEWRWHVARDTVFQRDAAGKVTQVIGTAEDITNRKNSELALMESQRFIERIAFASPHIMYVYDLQLESNVWVNRQVTRDLGLSPSQLQALGKDFLPSLVHPEDWPRWQEVFPRWRAAKDGEVIEYEYRMKHADGSWRWFIGRDTVFQRNSAGEVTQVIGTAQEISSRKNAELALQESQRFIEKIAQSSPFMIYVYDVKDEKLIWANRHLPIDLGYSTEEMIKLGAEFLPRMLHPEDMLKVLEYRRKQVAVKDGETIEGEYRVKHKDGNWRHMLTRDAIFLRNEKGAVVQVVGSAQDITERKKSELALAESKRFIEKIAEACPFILYVYDNKLEEVIWSNRRLPFELGYTAAEVEQLGKPLLPKLMHPDDFKKVQEHRQNNRSAKDGDVMEGTFRFKHADGTFRHMIAREAVFQRDESGAVWQVVGSIQDVTERLKLEEQLLQAQKMESVGRLAGGVAHDFNNLLTAIIGFTELCIKLDPENATAQTYLKNIQEAANRGAKLTQQLLAFARKQVIELKPIDLNYLMRSCSDLLRRLIGEDIEVLTIPKKELWLVNADPHQLEQVLMNLALNARDAMPQGGKLTLETTNLSVDADFIQGAADLPAGDYVLLAVSDTGHGIPQKLIAHIFEPFFTTKPQGKGTGLGLATCYGIIKQHRGHINVYSEENKGTTFKVYLPRSLDKKAENEKPVTPSRILSGRETVLIVEDFDMLRSIAELVLQQQGYRVLCATDGIEALNKSRAYGGKIDLVVTDVVMPRMGGSELAKTLQAERPEIKVLFSSGYTENAIAHHGVLDPGIHFIQKPYKPVALAEKVRSILDGAQ